MLELAEQLDDILPAALDGRIVRTIGMTAAAAGFPAPVGALVEIQRHAGAPLEAEVIGFRDDLTLLFPFDDLGGIRQGDRVRLKRTKNRLRVGEQLLGRVIDARGVAIDGRPQPMLSHRAPLDRRPPNPVERPRIDTPISTGVRVIDGCSPAAKGSGWESSPVPASARA